MAQITIGHRVALTTLVVGLVGLVGCLEPPLEAEKFAFDSKAAYQDHLAQKATDLGHLSVDVVAADPSSDPGSPGEGTASP